MPATESSLGIVAYLTLFCGVGLVFLFVNLLVGRFLRPHDPHVEKLEIYECGEPTIGSSFVQFDLRFYVVALLFIIFDVEVAFFFPWATVFGKASHLADPVVAVVQADGGDPGLSPQAVGLYREMGVRNAELPKTVPPSLRASVAATSPERLTPEEAEQVIRQGATQLAWVTLVDIVVFFAVLLVGFAYVWKRGDLDWVRAVSERRRNQGPVPRESSPEQEPVLSA